jgi:hypothetical protein
VPKGTSPVLNVPLSLSGDSVAVFPYIVPIKGDAANPDLVLAEQTTSTANQVKWLNDFYTDFWRGHVASKATTLQAFENQEQHDMPYVWPIQESV